MATVKLLDFWAPWCIDPNTPVLTENGYLSASEIKVGMNVVSVDPVTYQHHIKQVTKTKVFHQAPSKKIILESGRTLVGDNNHQVLVKEGFKKLSQLIKGDQILIDPSISQEPIRTDSDDVILLTTGNIYADQILTKLGLLPLKANDPRLVILSKIIGFVVTDGYLYEDLKHNIYETHFFVGTEQDVIDVKQDLVSLGFEKLEIKRQTKNFQIGGRDVSMTCYRCRNLNRALFFLLKALGTPVGRKKNQSYFVPEWIFSADRAVKKAFLSGWIGGDGCKIEYFVRYENENLSSHYCGFRVNDIEFHKEKELEREGILYAQQLVLLLEEMGVKAGKVESVDDEDGVIISFRIATDYQSLLALTEIGYAYAATKQTKIPFIQEFLRYRLFEKNKYAQVKEVVRSQIALGLSNHDIAQDMQIPVNTVVSWKYAKSSTVHPPLNGEARFDRWLEERQQGKLLWEKVSLIEEADNRDVIGITVESDPHTIITNGMISHNCGPCKIMNPIIEELEKELEGKITVEKYNVDEAQEISSKYGVMSIPTYVVLKNDKEVGRRIGVTSKQELLKLING